MFIRNWLKRSGIFLLIYVFFLVACNNEVEDSIGDKSESSWELIQTRILEPNCVACHQPGTSFARQSNLVLTAKEGYGQLVNRKPHNPAARADGFELVGTQGLESLYKSYLWEKINAPDFEHYYNDHTEYGELMPLGGPFLTYGELEYISDWITAGAPREGFVAEEGVLENNIRFEIPINEFERLTPPQSGIQLNLGPFEVAPNFEREFFFYQPLNNNEPLYVNRVEITMRPKSHHFILYDFPQEDFPETETYRDVRTSAEPIIWTTLSSIINQRFVFGTQWRTIDYSFPEGVALRIDPNWGFDMNSHYVNRTDQPVEGEVSLNLHTVEETEVIYVAENLFLNNTDIFLPAGEVTTLEKDWIFHERRYIFQLYSHAHENMTEFRIFIIGGPRDGELVYYARDWQHPPLLEIDPPLVLEAGEGLKAVATYDNDTERNQTFGLFSVDEMMIVLGAYYID